MLLIIQSTILIIEFKETAMENIFLPRINIINYNVLIDGRNLYDQTINDQIKKYDEVRKIATVQGDGYTAGCFSDHQHFKDHFQLLANYLSKQE